MVSVDDLVRGRLQGRVAGRVQLSALRVPADRSSRSTPLPCSCSTKRRTCRCRCSKRFASSRTSKTRGGCCRWCSSGSRSSRRALRLPHMRQMRQRVTTHCELQPLGREGVYGYVGHRLTVAGATGDRLRFTGEALDLVFEASGGVPRVINRLCDRALQHGQQARAATIGPDLVRAASDDLQLVPPAREDVHPPLVPAPLPLAAVLASVAGADTAVADEPAPAVAAVRPIAPAATASMPAGPAEPLAEPLAAQVRRPAEPPRASTICTRCCRCRRRRRPASPPRWRSRGPIAVRDRPRSRARQVRAASQRLNPPACARPPRPRSSCLARCPG